MKSVKIPVLAILMLLAFSAGCSAPKAVDHPGSGNQTPKGYGFFVEFADGHSVIGTEVHHDTTTDLNTLSVNDTTPPVTFPHVRVKRILTVSDPIRPPEEIRWSQPSPPQIIDTSHHWKDSGDCDCRGHNRSDGFQFFDAKLGAGFKGTSTYTHVTQGGLTQDNSVFFGPSNAGGSQLDINADVAGGYRIGKWDLGLSLEVIPTDSFIYFPLSAHARYYFEANCCSWNVFANVGIPFDFQTGAPVFITPLFSNRQRRFVSLGVGKLWPLSSSFVFAADLGYRYMVIPLAQIQCCPDIMLDNRFPARESQSLFLQLGLSF